LTTSTTPRRMASICSFKDGKFIGLKEHPEPDKAARFDRKILRPLRNIRKSVHKKIAIGPVPIPIALRCKAADRNIAIACFQKFEQAERKIELEPAAIRISRRSIAPAAGTKIGIT